MYIGAIIRKYMGGGIHFQGGPLSSKCFESLGQSGSTLKLFLFRSGRFSEGVWFLGKQTKNQRCCAPCNE